MYKYLFLQQKLTSCGGTYDCAVGIPKISPSPPKESPLGAGPPS